MTKSKKKQIAERALEKRRQDFVKRRALGADDDSGPDLSNLVAALEAAEARDAGLSVAEWTALSECERTKLFEDAEDRKSAANSGRTLPEFRRWKRRRIENGEMREPYTGFPSWLRDEYAAERPAEVVVEYLQLVRALDITSGPALKEILNKIAARTWRGWVIDRTPEEARTLLLQEIERVGLADLFAVAVAETMKKGGTIQ